ncbi:hypothetical protein QWM81_04865 [Streptomyces ficellus]|uniref:Uncharacterized protein n=1 Tax=Streptomyces ficellus TaxID=1977088 RepID=A0ABT7Z1L5_9ACTN|nr:hypothetical protein [Streptomyces ficellus]MDN3293385.1 hypothetical protein [Streptomyces ficellus]
MTTLLMAVSLLPYGVEALTRKVYDAPLARPLITVSVPLVVRLVTAAPEESTAVTS